GTDSRQSLVGSASSAAQGVIAGEVYDDTTGLPIAAAVIVFSGPSLTGQPYTQSATSDTRGRYLIRTTAGSGVLRITRDGWSRVDRLVDVLADKSVDVVDARLT